MAYVPRTLEEIRDTHLANLSSRYQNEGRTIDITPGSDAYMMAESMALDGAGYEAQLEYQATQNLVAQADTDNLNRIGEQEGVEREPPVKAVLTVRITGTNGAVALTGKSLQSSAGLTYAPTGSSATIAAGYADIEIQCGTAGAAGTLAGAEVLQWASAPVGVNTTATVQTIDISGVDEESDAAYAARILDRIRERPASMNRADWSDLVTGYDGVSDVFVYPLLAPVTNATETPGTLTILTLGPIAANANGVRDGDAVTNTRFMGAPGSTQTNVIAYMEGEVDSAGAATTSANERQLRPASLPEGNYTIETPARLLHTISVQIENNLENAFPFSGTMTTAGVPTTTLVPVVGSHVAKVGLPMLLFVGTSVVRGGYVVAIPASGVINGGNTDFTFTAGDLPGAPTTGTTVYPAPPNYAAIRLAVLRYFDTLGPGDSSPPARWPNIGVRAPAKLTRSAIEAAILGVGGVIDVAVITPAANVTPAVKTMIDLNSFILATV